MHSDTMSAGGTISLKNEINNMIIKMTSRLIPSSSRYDTDHPL